MRSTFSDMPRSVNEQGQLIEDHQDDRLRALGSEPFDRRGDYSGSVRHRTASGHYLQSFRTAHPKLIIMSEIDRSEEKGVLTREADVDFSVHVFPLGGRAESGYEFLERGGILGGVFEPGEEVKTRVQVVAVVEPARDCR
jgi:hypothetical protein